MVALCAALTACKESKQDKCKKTWDQMNELAREMAKAFGGSEADMPTAEDKKKFMDQCLKLSDEALACMTDPSKMMDPKCEEILAKAEEAEPVTAAKLEWESAPVSHKRATAQVPKGWTYEEGLGDMWLPPETADLGGSTFEIRDTCGGECTAQPAAEWAKRIEENEVANLKSDPNTEIQRDEKIGETGRLIVASTKLGRAKQTSIEAFFWQEGGEIYFVCKADLARALSANVDDFANACKALKVESFSASYSE